jgi:hypothetical protein
MSTTFMSYSGSRIVRAELFRALREHGLRPWRDVESLDLGAGTTTVIEEQLALAWAVILWINEDILRSDFVASVELPAIARAWRRGLRIVPVFDGLAPEAAAELLSGHGIEVGDSNGYVVEPGSTDAEVAATIAERCIRSWVADAKVEGLVPSVRLVSYDDTADMREDAVLNLDWRHALTTGHLAGEESARLRRALTAATSALKEAYGAVEITAAVKAHLPLAVAVGHAFGETTGCTLRMLRGEEVWLVNRSIEESVPLLQEPGLKGPVATRTASVEVSVTRDVEAGVNTYIGEGNRYRHRVMLAPDGRPGRSSVSHPAAANAWARQVGDVLLTLADAPEVDRIDLFLATPVELAVAIGWWTNAVGPLSLMNWRGRTGPYEQMWVLP